MNYHNISKCDCANGDGIRVVLWVSGCLHQCKNCHNQQTWDENSGIPFDGEAIAEIFECLRQEEYNGLTLSGGDPFHPNNRRELFFLAKSIKESFPNKTIWLYTGFTWEQLMEFTPYDREILDYVDVLIDGRYVEELSKPSPMWKGSTNQRVIDVQKSIKENKVILY